MIHVRPERPDDADAIRDLLLAAFSTSAEADLVGALRDVCEDFRSWTAWDGNDLLGHVLFTPARADAGPTGYGLGPMAVTPLRQGQGIGSQLLRVALDRLAATGAAWAAVLGHPRYYPRFGFRPAREYGLACPWDAVPAPAFLVRELRPGGLRGVEGTILYRPEFSSLI